jgi:hypothetical protein
MTIFLTSTEIAELTGYLKPIKQIYWLKTQGFTFRIAADGRPRIDRSHYLKLMGGHADTSHQRTEPNFDSLENLKNR